jgi:hypothetical protein
VKGGFVMTTKTSIILAGSLLLAGLTACSDDNGPAAGAPSPSVGTGAPAGPSVAPAPDTSVQSLCVTGRWRATGVTSTAGSATIGGRIAGGSDVTMTVDADGTTEVGFSDSKPVTFAAEAAGARLGGQVQYSGSLHAAVKFEPNEAGAGGRWQPQNSTTDDDLRATVRLTEPFSVTLLDNASIRTVDTDALPAAGDALDLQPILRGGTYRCQADSLQVRTEQGGPNLQWTFTRVGE